MIRNAFVSTPGWTLIEADYSQLELRIGAWYSSDPVMIEAYQKGVDFHTIVASEIFSVPPEKVTHDQRYVAKYVDFGIIYGRGAKSLAEDELKCSVKKAQEYIDSFLARFPGLRRWISEQHDRVLEQGYVETPFGRRRRFPCILDFNKGEVLRQCVNSPIQSMASDLCLTALTRLVNRLDRSKARVLLTVHDSILLEATKDYVSETINVVREEMELGHGIPTPIPFKIDIKTGQRWGSLEKLKATAI
jgi:DNA polymerase-1